MAGARASSLIRHERKGKRERRHKTVAIFIWRLNGGGRRSSSGGGERSAAVGGQAAATIEVGAVSVSKP
jgi:hypothetical protein